MTTRALRGLAAAVRLGLRRARRHPGRWAPAMLGIALGVAVLAGLGAYALVVGDRAAAGGLAGLTAQERTVRVDWNGGLPADVDRDARRAVAGATRAPQLRNVLLQPARLGRSTVRIGAVTPLAPAVRLTRGRLPRGCGPAGCEVLQVGGPAVGPVLGEDGVRVVVVGVGRLVSAIPLGFVPADDAAGRTAREPPLLLAADVDGLEASEGLAGVYRVHGWSAPLALAGVRAWELRGLAARIEAAGSRAASAHRGLRLTAPVAELTAAAERADAAPGRLAGLAAGAGAALVAFLLTAAGRLRAGLAGELERLRRRGASGPQRFALATVECAVPVVLGVALGVILIVVVVVAGGFGNPDARDILRFGLGRSGAVTGLLLASPIALAVLLLGCLIPAPAATRLADVALAAGVAAVVALGRAPDAGVALPVLVCALGALVAARLAPVVLRVGGRLARNGPARLAALQLVRRPAPAMLAIAGLTASVSLGVFAATYRATLERGVEEQASFRVPLDLTVLPGPSLAGPLSAVGLPDVASVPGVERALPVVRRDAAAVNGPTRRDATLIGVPGAAAGALGVPVPPASRRGAGIALGRSTAVRVDAAAVGGAVEVRALVRRPDGVVSVVTMGTASRQVREVRAAIPPLARGGELVGIGVREPAAVRATSAHQQAEDVEGALVGGGTLRLGAVRDDAGRALGSFARWRGAGAVRELRTVAAAGATTATQATLRFDDTDGLLRPVTATDSAPLPVRVDAATARDAGPGGTFAVAVGGAELPVAVVGVAARPATVTGERWIVADGPSLSTAIDAQVPGAGTPREVWIAGRPSPRSVAERTGAAVRTRAALAARLDAEPLGRGTRQALLAAAALAAVLAALGLVLATGGARRDQAAELEDLEADGAAPATLRRVVGLQVAAVGGLGVLSGLAVGAVLTTLTVDAAARATDAQASVPPLRVELAPAAAALAVLVALVVAAVVVLVLASRAFRDDWPGRTASTETA